MTHHSSRELFADCFHTKEFCADLILYSLLWNGQTSFLIDQLHQLISYVIWPTKLTRCTQFESMFWACFVTECMTFSWCLWRAHWFLWISSVRWDPEKWINKLLVFVLLMQGMNCFPFIHHTVLSLALSYRRCVVALEFTVNAISICVQFAFLSLCSRWTCC